MRNFYYWLGAVIGIGGVVAVLQFSLDHRWGWPYLLSTGPGNLLDLWVFVHGSVGVLLAKWLFQRVRKYFGAWWRWKVACLVLTLAFSWEGFELTLEAGAAGESVREWFGGHEHWTNRLIVDPLTPLLSIAVWRYYPRIWYLAIGFVLLWWTLLCFVPDAMGIDDRIHSYFETS